MNLEPVRQSEVNQIVKNKYHILMHIYGTWKDSTDDPTCRAEEAIQIFRTQWGKERVG